MPLGVQWLLHVTTPASESVPSACICADAPTVAPVLPAVDGVVLKPVGPPTAAAAAELPVAEPRALGPPAAGLVADGAPVVGPPADINGPPAGGAPAPSAHAAWLPGVEIPKADQ